MCSSLSFIQHILSKKYKFCQLVAFWKSTSPTSLQLTWQLLDKLWVLRQIRHIFVLLFVKIQLSAMNICPATLACVWVKLDPFCVSPSLCFHWVTHDLYVTGQWLAAVILRSVRRPVWYKQSRLDKHLEQFILAYKFDLHANKKSAIRWLGNYLWFIP